MAIQDIPQIGDKLYLMNKEVIVTRVYLNFQLIKIHYVEDPAEFFIDIFAATRSPDTTNSIALGLLRRECS